MITTVILWCDVWLSSSSADSGSDMKQREARNHFSAVDPVGNYLLKRPQSPHTEDEYYPPPEMTSHDKRMADPVGSYLLRRRVDPVGSYLLKKSTD